ncbi:MAG: LytTR family DNA-binding domain-containing protein [Clostridiales bacterium]|nr:LytTR family DNA-binding domain-containing protein [Clostridiales bacterium]
MKLNVAVCDDNEDYLKRLMERVGEVLSASGCEYSVCGFSNADEMLLAVGENPFNIVLSDVEMPDMNGFEMKDRLYDICPDAYVIFVTAHQELAYQSYMHRPYWFLSKKDIDKLDDVLSELARKILYLGETDVAIKTSSGRRRIINVKTTVYVTTHKNYIIVHDSCGETSSFRGTIKDTYQILKQWGFIYIKNGYIVNCRFIAGFNCRWVTLSDGTKISVTKDEEKFDEAVKLYSKFKREMSM